MTGREAENLAFAIEDLIWAVTHTGIDGNPDLPRVRTNLVAALIPIEIPRYA